jgi:carnitine-CoA ligase
VVDDEGRDVGANVEGELLVKTPIVMQGYFRDPVQTREAFVDGWFKTGDIVSRDADGYFFFVSRNSTGDCGVVPRASRAAEGPAVRAVRGRPSAYSDAQGGEDIAEERREPQAAGRRSAEGFLTVDTRDGAKRKGAAPP